MTYLADQVKGGIDPLQNHSLNSVEVLETRQTRYACRVVNIDPETQAPVVEDGTVGDVLCATNWQPTTRPIGGWAHAWPVIGGSPVQAGGGSASSEDSAAFVRAAAGAFGGVLAAGGTSQPGAAGANKGKGQRADYIILDPSKTLAFGHTVGRIGRPTQDRLVFNPKNTLGIGWVYPGAAVKYGFGAGKPPGGGGGAAGVGGAMGSAGPGGSYGNAGPRANRVVTGEGSPDQVYGVFQPVQDSVGRADDGFEQRSQPLPVGYPALPTGSYGTWLGGTEHRGEEPFYLHGDPRMAAVNNGPDYRAGSTVFDTDPTDGSHDLGRMARLQSAWRVMPQPTSNTLVTGRGGTLALQLTRAERDGAWGYGAMVDISSATAPTTLPAITPTVPAQTAPSSTPVTPAAAGILAYWNGWNSTLGAAAQAAALQAAFAAQAYQPTPKGAGAASQAGANATQRQQKALATPVQTMGLFSARVGGPLEVGHGKKDKHRVGDSGEAGVNVGHLATHAPFFADPYRDGPLGFERDPFPLDLQHFPLKAPVHIQYDGTESPGKYAMQRTLGKGAPPGVWRLWAEVPEMKEGGYPPPPPTTGPPDEPPWKRPLPPPPTQPPPTTVTEPPRRVPTKRPNPLIGSFLGAAPGGWAADGSGPMPVAYKGGGTSMGVVDRQPSRNRQPVRGVVDLPTGSPLDPPAPKSTAATVAQRKTLGNRPDEVTSHALATATTAALWRASETRAGRPDVLTSAAFPADVVADELGRRPFVLRQEGWGAASQQGYTLTQRRGASRYANGTGAGGVVLLPPELDLQDVSAGSSPFATSTSYFAAYTGVWFGCGTPVLTSGSLKTGARWGFDGTSYVLQGLSATSVAVTGVRVKTDGTPGLRESGGTILDLAGISDGLFLKRTGSTIVGASLSTVINLAERTSVTDIDNTVTETSIMPTGAYSVAGGTMGTSGGLRVDVFGRIKNDSGSTASPTLKVKFGGVTVYEGAMSIATSAVTRAFSLHIHIRNRSTSVQDGELDVQVGAPAAPTTGYSSPVVTSHIDGLGGFDTGSTDTTTSQTLDITWTWDTADANKTLSIRGGVLYIA